MEGDVRTLEYTTHISPHWRSIHVYQDLKCSLSAGGYIAYNATIIVYRLQPIQDLPYCVMDYTNWIFHIGILTCISQSTTDAKAVIKWTEIYDIHTDI